MTSEATHDVIVDFFKKGEFLGLQADDVHFFKQGVVPLPRSQLHL